MRCFVTASSEYQSGNNILNLNLSPICIKKISQQWDWVCEAKIKWLYYFSLIVKITYLNGTPKLNDWSKVIFLTLQKCEYFLFNSFNLNWQRSTALKHHVFTESILTTVNLFVKLITLYLPRSLSEGY